MENNDDNRVFTTSVRAGRRTYFFDLKKTKEEKTFLTVTESKKFTDFETGEVKFEKHRIFIYEEDYNNFIDALSDTIKKAKENS